jgi:hypothetical protein
LDRPLGHRQKRQLLQFKVHKPMDSCIPHPIHSKETQRPKATLRLCRVLLLLPSLYCHPNESCCVLPFPPWAFISPIRCCPILTMPLWGGPSARRVWRPCRPPRFVPTKVSISLVFSVAPPRGSSPELSRCRMMQPPRSTQQQHSTMAMRQRLERQRQLVRLIVALAIERS